MNTPPLNSKISQNTIRINDKYKFTLNHHGGYL